MNIIKVTYNQEGNEISRQIIPISLIRQETISKMIQDRKGSVVQTSARLFISPTISFEYSERIIYKTIFQGIEKDLISIQDNYNLSNVLDHYEVYI